MMFNNSRILILIFLLFTNKIKLIETGDFSDILENEEVTIPENLQDNIFEKKNLLSQDERMKKLLFDYENQINQFNNNLIKIKNVKVGNFNFKLTKSCFYDLKETEKNINKEEEKLPQCKNGEISARHYVFSSIHFLLKSLKAKLFDGDYDKIIENTFDACYFEKNSLTMTKNFNRISLFRICFKNSLKYYVKDLKIILKKKMSEIRLKKINVRTLESELVSINSN